MNLNELADIIMFAVCEAANVTQLQVREKNRKKPLPDVRKVMCYMLDKHVPWSMNAIAEYLNYADHSMVIKGREDCETVTRGINPDLYNMIQQVEPVIAERVRLFRQAEQVVVTEISQQEIQANAVEKLKQTVLAEDAEIRARELSDMIAKLEKQLKNPTSCILSKEFTQDIASGLRELRGFYVS